MSFLLGPALGALGSLLFKADGGRIELPQKQSAKMNNLSMKPKYKVQPMYPQTQMYKKGGKIKKKKDKK